MTTEDRPSDGRRSIADYLAKQRWFSGSEEPADIEITDTRALGWLSDPLDGLGVRIELVTVRTPAGERTYNLPLSYRREPVDANAYGLIGAETWSEGDFYVYDALHDHEARLILMRGFFGGAGPTDLDYVTRVELGPETDAAIAEDSPSVLLAVDQSNTSIVIDDVALLKVFRRVVPGRNPDIEIHAALSETDGDSVAEILGWLSTNEPDSAPGYDLAMLQRFLRTATDGWESARASIRDLLADPDLEPQEAGGDFAAESERLGATLAYIHDQMAEHLETQVWGRQELGELADRLRGRLDALIERAPELGDYAEAIRARYARVAGLDISVRAQRVHGDLHLGQTLRTSVGWKIIDFEGEPAAPLADRVRLDSPARDLAGMLRSFDYVARSFLLQTGASGSTERADAWVQRNRDAFLRGYGFADDVAPAILLGAYEIDKAAYEVVYEAAHRADWVSIPLRAIETLARR